MMKKDTNKYPKGWNRSRVQQVIAHVDGQNSAEAISEAEAAWANSQVVMLRVPIGLAEEVRALIARRQADELGVRWEDLKARHGLTRKKRKTKRSSRAA